jgi:hypothetical protein
MASYSALTWQVLRTIRTSFKTDATHAAAYGQVLFSARRRTPTLPSRSHSVSLSRGTCLDWTRRTNNVATTVARPHASGLLPVGIRKRRCLRPRPPVTIYLLRARITDATGQVDADTLRWKCYERAYLWYICRVTRGSHIEHLWLKLDNILLSSDTIGCDTFCFGVIIIYFWVSDLS